MKHAARQTVSTGIRLSTSGMVRMRSHIPGLAVSSVRGDGDQVYNVVIRYENDLSGIDAVSCSCPGFTRDESMVFCSHIIATALQAQRVPARQSDKETEKTWQTFLDRNSLLLRKVPDTVENEQSEAEKEVVDTLRSILARIGHEAGHDDNPVNLSEYSAQADAQSRGRRTDRLASQLLRDATAKATIMLASDIRENDPLALSAVLMLDRWGPARLSFRVGFNNGGRMYVVKDLSVFIDCVEMCGKYNLGTKYTVTLDRGSFTEESLPLLEYLMERYDYMSNGYGRARNRRDMAPGPGEIDAFFSIANGESLRLSINGSERAVDIQDGGFALRIRAERVDDPAENSGLILRALDTYSLIQGQKQVYVVSDKTIYKCPADYTGVCRDLLKALSANNSNLFFAAQDVPALFANIIRKAGPYLNFEISDEVGQITPPELETRVYFDLDEAGYVTARMDFSYGGATHDAFEEPKRADISLDPVAETYAERVLYKYMGRVNSGPGTLIVLDNEHREERLYILATEGVDKIREFAEVFMSESFDTLKARPPISISIGVRVDGRLLTLNIDAGGIDFSELAGVLRSYRLAKKYHRLKDGSFLALEGGALGELSELTEGLDIDPGDFRGDEEGTGQSTLSLDLNRAMYIDTMMKRNEALRYDRDKNFRSIIRNFSDVADADYQLPGKLQGTLRGYQETGFRWLRALDALGFGGILADDMGLGKTLEVLALIASVKEEQDAVNRLPSLVVCPASLVLNWESEAKKFTPGLNVQVILGSASERKKIIAKIGKGKAGKQAADIFVTSYDLLKRDIDAYDGARFHFVVIDEAQYIKNQTTQNAKSVKLLDGRTKLALTGTPIENTLAELWSIFDFLMPGYLFRYSHFRRKYEVAIVKNTDKKAEKRLNELVRPFILRRLKKDVLKELPDKIETVLRSEMEDEQRKLYVANMARTKKELADKLVQAGGPKAKFEILAALMRMRRICCDPSIVYENYTGGSAKLDACMELVQSCIESGHRILLFSQFTSMLDKIETRLRSANIEWFRLDGSTPVGERQGLMNKFNAGGVPVFLISLKAGGTGLNLTGADIVIHYDPWWNLSVQNQATDRAHRIGQTNMVQVFKLIAKDTIEERILEMQERKADLADRVIREGEDVLSSISEEELLSLFEG